MDNNPPVNVGQGIILQFINMSCVFDSNTFNDCCFIADGPGKENNAQSEYHYYLFELLLEYSNIFLYILVDRVSKYYRSSE